MKHVLPMPAVIIAATLTLAACSPKDVATTPQPVETTQPAKSASALPRASAVSITNIPLADVPESITSIIATAYPDFTPVEVLKKIRDGKTYFDVEGELQNNDEIEFDVLMTKSGPKIVEIQRDVNFDLTPAAVRKLVNQANTENLNVARVIESIQTSDSSTIYEIFVEGQPSDPTFEVQVLGESTKLLSKRAEH